jgi:hypothetical protein
MSIRTVLTAAVFAAGLTSAPAFAEDLIFMLDNQSSGIITHFYASTTDTNDWEEDILGQDVLEAGNFARITIADGKTICTYDLKIVFDSGEEMEDRSIDLCATGSYTVSD